MPWWPDKEFEQKHIQPEQDVRFEADPWEDPVGEYLARTSAAVLISQIAKDVLGFDGYSRLGTADARRIAAILEREGWERGKPAATPVASWAVGGPRCGGGQ